MKRLVVAVILVACLAGCSESESPPKKSSRLKVPSGKTQFTQRQHTTQPLPGSNGQVNLTLGDITARQVILSIATLDGQPVLPATSVKQGDSTSFLLDGARYTIGISQLSNVLIGVDTALLSLQQVNQDPGLTLTEERKIKLLIESVSALKGASFIRNEKKHTCSEAAEHLQRKWQWKKADIKTARDFIRIVASTSSTTGKTYLIHFPDGKQLEAGEYFLAKLAEIENSPQPADIAEFKADPPPAKTHFRDFKVERKALEDILSKWYQVSQAHWQHGYSHVASGDRTGTIKLKDGTIIRWMVKPGGLACFTFKNGNVLYFAKELTPWEK